MFLPKPRGPVSRAVLDALQDDDPERLATVDVPRPADAVTDDDQQLALWACYELHYRGFDAVADHWEWEPALIGLRRELERHLLDALRAAVGPVGLDGLGMAERLQRLVDEDDGPSLSRHLQTEADREQYLEFLQQRSIYQLKEADPHTWAVPRLAGRAKAALVEIQVDEYGNGDPQQVHAELFRTTLRELGLDDTYGAYVDDVPGITLTLSNVMSMFGLRRDLRGAIVGHLAAYEMTSSAPCRRYARGLRRVGGSDAACAFYDVHVNADALHEQVAAHDLCGGLAEAEPELEDEILFGAAACLYVDKRFAEHILGRWRAGRSSLASSSTGREQHALAEVS